MDQSERKLTPRIVEQIKGQITSGTYVTGARLPSTRALASEWGVSRTTVTAAYEQLIAEGYLETRQGARATVAPGLEPPKLRSTTTAQASLPLSAFGQRLMDLSAAPSPELKHRIDFRYGDLATSDFPILSWRKALGAALLTRPTQLRYGDPCGSARLRGELRGYLWRARGLVVSADHIIVVNGSQQGLDLCARLLLNPGDNFLIEDPGYHLAQQVFTAAGGRAVAKTVDREGMQTHDLPPARLAYVTPSHQFPLGSVLSASRRHQLLDWANRTGAVIVEDDYDGEYRYDIAPIPPLRALDEKGPIIYLGTVSKTLSPTLRIGYLVVPAGLSEAFARAKRLSDRHAPVLEQDALAHLISSGSYERHIRSMRRRNGSRRTCLLHALAKRFGESITVEGADAGLHVVAWLKKVPSSRQGELITRAADKGLGLYPVLPLYSKEHANFPSDQVAGLIIGYASLDERSIRAGVDCLARIVESMV